MFQERKIEEKVNTQLVDKIARVDLLIKRYKTAPARAREIIGVRKTDSYNVIHLSQYRKAG